jgi:hypothetical protein
MKRFVFFLFLFCATTLYRALVPRASSPPDAEPQKTLSKPWEVTRAADDDALDLAEVARNDRLRQDTEQKDASIERIKNELMRIRLGDSARNSSPHTSSDSNLP